jgi:hypothetical protein
MLGTKKPLQPLAVAEKPRTAAHVEAVAHKIVGPRLGLYHAIV